MRIYFLGHFVFMSFPFRNEAQIPILTKQTDRKPEFQAAVHGADVHFEPSGS